VSVGGIGIPWSGILFAMLACLFVWSFIRMDKARRKSLWILLILPAIWIFVGLWAGTFWLDWQHHPVQRNPSWVIYPIYAAPWVAIATTIFLAFKLAGARLLTLAFGLINVYFTFFFAFMSAMAVTGDWL
jgi:hypothetical protein